MINILEQMTYWHWFIAGMVLLGLETLGIGGFLIGAGIAALIQGLIVWIIPTLGWEYQLVLFSVSAIVFSWVYWKFFRHINEKTDSPNINDRAGQMIGHTAIVIEEIINGKGKIQIGDVLWDATSKDNIAKGKKIKVIGADKMLLFVEIG